MSIYIGMQVRRSGRKLEDVGYDYVSDDINLKGAFNCYNVEHVYVEGINTVKYTSLLKRHDVLIKKNTLVKINSIEFLKKNKLLVVNINFLGKYLEEYYSNLLNEKLKIILLDDSVKFNLLTNHIRNEFIKALLGLKDESEFKKSFYSSENKTQDVLKDFLKREISDIKVEKNFLYREHSILFIGRGTTAITIDSSGINARIKFNYYLNGKEQSNDIRVKLDNDLKMMNEDFRYEMTDIDKNCIKKVRDVITNRILEIINAEIRQLEEINMSNIEVTKNTVKMELWKKIKGTIDVYFKEKFGEKALLPKYINVDVISENIADEYSEETLSDFQKEANSKYDSISDFINDTWDSDTSKYLADQKINVVDLEENVNEELNLELDNDEEFYDLDKKWFKSQLLLIELETKTHNIGNVSNLVSKYMSNWEDHKKIDE